jgi:hypothetical protein
MFFVESTPNNQEFFLALKSSLLVNTAYYSAPSPYDDPEKLSQLRIPLSTTANPGLTSC